MSWLSIFDNEQDDKANPHTTLDAAEVAEVLSVERRQIAIQTLEEAHQASQLPLAINDLTYNVASEVYSTDQVSSDQRKRVYVGLYQTHLPSLDELEVINWSHSRDEIHIGPEFAAVAAALENLEDVVEPERGVA